MLVLSRNHNEKIIIPLDQIKDLKGNLEIVVVEVRGDKVRLGFEANQTVSIYREEVWNAIQRNKRSPG